MQPRTRIIDLFATFAILEDDRFRRWLDEPRLQRNMQQQLTKLSDLDERGWAIYWHQAYPKHPLAQSHLTAYLGLAEKVREWH